MPSAGRVDGFATVPVTAKVAAKRWQFVNVKEPKRIQDKEVTSLVRAHAMRNVRRKQRLELTAQHRKKFEADALAADHAKLGVGDERPPQMNQSARSLGDQVDIDWPIALREILIELDNVDMADRTSRKSSENAAKGDEDARQPGYRPRDSEDETQAPEYHVLGKYRNWSPRSLVADGVFDPFDAMPMVGCPTYTSHVLNHFVSVMAINCLPVDHGKGENPLTKIWLPYALQDPTLFLATLTFAVAHLEILSGKHKSPRTLYHKGKSIKAVNAKLKHHEHALSNETIGAVAMLAAMESILGNYKDFRVHMKGLQRMVSMRGGLNSLGWDGVLHMFISWQDLLSSAMMASTPHFEQTPCCLLLRGTLPASNPIFPDAGPSTDTCADIATSFENMRYLSEMMTKCNQYQTTLDIMAFSKMRTEVVLRLLSFANQKPASEMTTIDYQVEICRLAALVYILVAVHMYLPLCAIVRSLKTQLMNLIEQGEANGTIGVGGRPQPGSVTWAMFIGGVLSLDQEEEEWFAQRLARGMRASGVETWAEMENRLRQTCWLDKLNTPTCRSLWGRIARIHAEHWAVQVRSVASDWDISGPFYWYPDSEERA